MRQRKGLLGTLRSIRLTVAVLGVTACAPVNPTASAVAAREITCETATWQPTASLTCGAAIAAAIAVLPDGHAAILREAFHWGILCPPGVPCAPPHGERGYVVVDFVDGPSRVIYIKAEPDGTVSADSPAPLPSGY